MQEAQKLENLKEILPDFDGRTLDNIVDFLNYTSLPLLFTWRAGVLPEHLNWWLLLPLLASGVLLEACTTTAAQRDQLTDCDRPGGRTLQRLTAVPEQAEVDALQHVFGQQPTHKRCRGVGGKARLLL